MQKSFRSLLFLLIIILASDQQLQAQISYLPGYVVTLTGDTLKGVIDFRDKVSVKGAIHFKKSQEGSVTAYSPQTIKGFGVNNEKFISATVQCEMSSRNVQDLQSDRGLQLETSAVFLQTLVEGEKGLYFYETPNGNEQFFILEGKTFQLLTYKLFLDNSGPKPMVGELKKYMSQLSNYLGACPSIQSSIQNLRYDRKSLQALFRTYYQCTAKSINFERKAEKTGIEIGLLAGTSTANLQFTSTSQAYTAILKGNFNPNSTNLSAGVFLNFKLPGRFERWSVANDLLYTTYSFKGVYNEYTSENEYKRTTTTFDFSYLKVTDMARYQFPVGNIDLFLNVGISNSFALIAKCPRVIENKFYNNTTIVYVNAIEKPRTYEQGFVSGVGALYKKYSLQFRYEITNGMSNENQLNTSVGRLFLLAGFRF